MGFTAVNGRQPSPPRSVPVEPPKDRDAGSQNGSRAHSATDGRPSPTTADDRPPPPAQPAYRPGGPEPDPAKMDSANPDRSPSKKRTYPEAFEHQQHPRAVPRESYEHRSPDGYQDMPAHAPYGNGNGNGNGNGHVQAGSPYSEDPGLDETDRRTMEALKANGGTASPPNDQYGMEEDEEDDDDGSSQNNMGHLMGSQSGTPTRTAAGVITKDAAKRKRVFSNRTKTGCLTCRKRKKKCDEKHPECQNCLRGGFVCEGYQPRASWQKPNPSQPRATPLQQLQIKGPGMAPQRQHSLHYPETPQDYARAPDHRHDEHRRELSMSGPPRPPHMHAQDPAPQPYPRPDGRYANHGLVPRYEADARDHNMHSGPVHDPGSYPPPPTSFPSHHPASHHGAPPAPIHPGTPATAVAQAALEHVTATLPPASTLVSGSPDQIVPRRPGQVSERDRMLQGDYYLPYTPLLLADRDQCAAALHRFNQACQNPSLGFAFIDRERLFRDIVNLRPTPDQPFTGPPLEESEQPESTVRPDLIIPRGSVGAGCVVEAPFQCDYGYNLTIGSDVVIGSHCRIADSSVVRIGNNVVLSPNVTLMCTTYGVDPKERRKGKGRALGRGIVIEDEAWIGTGATILPGVTVGKCSTVGAGSLCHKVGWTSLIGCVC